jgi:hypothetical protein
MNEVNDSSGGNGKRTWITTYRDLSPENKPDLLSARGALADLDDEMDEFIASIYREREGEKDRTT